MISWSCRHVTSCWILNTVLVQYEAFLPRKTVVHYREVLVKEKIKAFRINESVLEAFRIILHDTYTMTSSGARAMHGFGAMCLLRRSRCMFLAPQSAALRCPWVRALLVPVVRVPSCARGPPYVLLHMYNKYVLLYGTVVQYEKRADTNHERNST